MKKKKTEHDIFIENLKSQAKKAGSTLGHCAQKATARPSNYGSLDSRQQWAIDKTLGILDWDGNWNT